MAIFFAPQFIKKKVPLGSVTKVPIEPLVTILGPKDKFWYYLDIGHQQQGPMSHDALISAWKKGVVNLNTFVWNEELTEWKPFQEFVKTHTL